MTRDFAFASFGAALVITSSAAAFCADSSPTATLHVRPAAGTVAASAQGGLSGPLVGPLAAPSGSIACKPPVRHVAHRRRVVRRTPRMVVAASPIVPLVPYRPVYAYRPVPVYAYRPVYAYPYRPVFAYRPVVPWVGFRPVYRPFVYGAGFY